VAEVQETQQKKNAWLVLLVAGFLFIGSGIWAFMNPDAGRGALLPLGPTAFGFIGVGSGIAMLVQAFRARPKR
jgi:uncharacterized membrane protein HdeD (DUF308 family)